MAKGLYVVRDGQLRPLNVWAVRDGQLHPTGLTTGPGATPPDPTPTDPGGGGGGAGPDPALWQLTYSTEFANVTGWTVNNNQTQGNDNSINIAANVVPASVSGGTGLTIYGRRESGYSRPYTSGEIEGHGAQVVGNYFRAEVVARHDDVSGIWPANLWYRPQSGGDGSNGEIDVHEYMGGRSENLTRKRIAVTMHNEYGATQDSIKKPIYHDQLSNPSVTDWHTYVIEKTPGQIVVTIDGERTSTFTAADKTWWNRIMEASNRTWYPRITLQIGTGASTNVVPNPPTSWTESTMQVRSLKQWAYIG